MVQNMRFRMILLVQQMPYTPHTVDQLDEVNDECIAEADKIMEGVEGSCRSNQIKRTWRAHGVGSSKSLEDEEEKFVSYKQ